MYFIFNYVGLGYLYLWCIYFLCQLVGITTKEFVDYAICCLIFFMRENSSYLSENHTSRYFIFNDNFRNL